MYACSWAAFCRSDIYPYSSQPHALRTLNLPTLYSIYDYLHITDLPLLSRCNKYMAAIFENDEHYFVQRYVRELGTERLQQRREYEKQQRVQRPTACPWSIRQFLYYDSVAVQALPFAYSYEHHGITGQRDLDNIAVAIAHQFQRQTAVWQCIISERSRKMKQYLKFAQAVHK